MLIDLASDEGRETVRNIFQRLDATGMICARGRSSTQMLGWQRCKCRNIWLAVAMAGARPALSVTDEMPRAQIGRFVEIVLRSFYRANPRILRPQELMSISIVMRTIVRQHQITALRGVARRPLASPWRAKECAAECARD
jgi:hypothetical protein